jgi:hypothetical protein
MKRVNQSILTVPGGDCFRACVASIFELPLELVPHFLAGAGIEDNWTDAQWLGLVQFAQARGYHPWWIDTEKDPTGDARERLAELERSAGYYVATLRPCHGSRVAHCVVMQHGRVVHNPAGPQPFPSAAEPFLYICFLGLADSRRVL